MEMDKNQMKNKNNSEKNKWKRPEVILLTRNEPEKVAIQDCCSANMSLLDSGCNRPMRG